MDGLNVKAPDDIPHATEYVDAMVEMIGSLVEASGAPTAPTTASTCRSRPSRTTGCWRTSRSTTCSPAVASATCTAPSTSAIPADFVLWKLSKDPGEPSWPSPWGDGRPGWHSECVVMSLELLGEGFDLHGGGQDLRFPHHENERAQAVALGKRFAGHWVHNGWVVDTEDVKMSKSLGNVANVLDLVERYDGRAYRLVVLQSHYRGPVRVVTENLEAATKALEGLDAFAARAHDVLLALPDEEVLARFGERMDHDLDTPGAMAVVFDTVRRANAALDAGDPSAGALVAAVGEMCSALGLELEAGEDVPDEARARAGELDAARAGGDYALADSPQGGAAVTGLVGRDGEGGDHAAAERVVDLTAPIYTTIAPELLALA